jgi:hypothetical protein
MASAVFNLLLLQEYANAGGKNFGMKTRFHKIAVQIKKLVLICANLCQKI